MKKKNTLISVAIDDEEVSPLRLLMKDVFTKEAGVGVVKVNPQSRKTKGKFSPVHEYAIFMVILKSQYQLQLDMMILNLHDILLKMKKDDIHG